MVGTLLMAVWAPRWLGHVTPQRKGKKGPDRGVDVTRMYVFYTSYLFRSLPFKQVILSSFWKCGNLRLRDSDGEESACSAGDRV